MPLFRGAKRWMILVTGLLFASILLAACGEGSPSILNPAGPVARDESGVFYIILIIATIVFVGVEGMLIYSVIRYRERPGSPNPRQIHGNTTIEIIWTVVPAVILFVVLIFTIQGLFSVAAQPAGKTVEVEAVGHQWWWEFYYPEYKITTADTLHVPVNTVVHVTLYSNNVIHSFWVPELTGKTDVIPGHNNDKWFKADKTGTFLGICAEYCGTQHANMKFDVAVDNNDSFQTWVSAQQQVATQPTSGSLAQQGQKIFQEQCQSCHGIVGVDMKSYQDPKVSCDSPTAACLVGPNLTHFGSRGFIAGGVLTNNANQCQPGPDIVQRCNLAKWLNDPQGIKPGNDMAIGQLTTDQINQLVAYLEGLK
ncbi:cytochrome c oxidase subunit II [Ktedonosporobacter rubrisoli]|uniref:Cytochrome c oxidase subunit 2 n=1 Tax=Ktedonosporobacter rubrisoli TaxID=2509675 RepID=A0A4P6JZM6_KTERU|nr:cytochrome c oxidase subunit II [Ktedonosporobacter rubrisoli]QBD81204.1 cytochrome c oxidase subunit II [Ktedonosporobacter rubrisoli]